jgi:hypothetical protein
VNRSSRLVRQLLTESLLLAFAATLRGVIFAYSTVHLIVVRLSPARSAGATRPFHSSRRKANLFCAERVSQADPKHLKSRLLIEI